MSQTNDSYKKIESTIMHNRNCLFAILLLVFSIACVASNSQTKSLLQWGGFITFRPTQLTRGAITLVEGKGADHILFVQQTLNTSKLYGVGSNEKSQLGQGTSSGSITNPVEISGVTNISLIATGKEHSIVVTAQKDVFTFGSNSNGQLGVDTLTIPKQDSPTLLSSILLNAGESIISACAGEASSYILTSTNRLFVFGDNTKGQFVFYNSSFF